MSILSTTVPPAVAPAANAANQSSGSARGTEAGTNQSSNAQRVAVSQQPAVVLTLSTAKDRGSSTGEARKVDAGFEKQEAEGKSKAVQQDLAAEEKTKVDVTA